MWFGDEDEAARLEAEGSEAIGRGDLDGARGAAARLIDMGWSGGFIVRALADRAAGRLDAAIDGLVEAVERAPRAWPLWHLLGNLRSDTGAHDLAIEAFDQALSCEGAVAVAIHFNRAVAHRRAGRFGDALADLDPILSLPKPPAEIADATLALTLECLANLGRAEDALTLIESALATCPEGDPRRGKLHAEHALALDRAGAAPADVEAALAIALDAGVATVPTLELARRLEGPEAGPRDDERRRYQLVAQGTAPDGADAAGFLRVFDVVAASPEVALERCRRFVPAHAREGLSLERCEVREESSELDAGVHGASELMWFA